MGVYTPAGIAVNSSETILYVAGFQSNLLLVYDLRGTGADLISAVGVSGVQVNSLEGVVVSPAGDRIYVANSQTDSIAVISTENYLLVSVIELTPDFHPLSLALSTDGKKLYAAGLYSGFAEIDMSQTPMVTRYASIPGGVLSLAISQDGSKVYAPSNTFDILTAVSAEDLSQANFPLAAGPRGISITPDGAKLYVTMNTATYGDSVRVFDTASNMVTKTIPLPADSRPTSIGNFIGPVLPYTITATQGQDCYILPLGPVAVNGLGRRFDIAASSGQCEVTVDGQSVGLPDSYTVTNISGDHVIDASQAAVGTYYTLTVEPSGPLSSYVFSTPAGIGLQSSSAKFLSGALVTLQAGTGSVVTNWGGVCAGTTGSSCSLYMDSDKYVTATLADIPSDCPVKRGQNCYTDINAAINEASSGDIIRVAASYAGSGINTAGGPTGYVTISGGWDNINNLPVGISTLQSSIFSTQCAIVVENLAF